MSRATRDKNILIRVSEVEKETFQDAADLAGIPLSAWMRERLRRVAIEELENNKQPIALFEDVRVK